ncbi:MAG TPA: hypothetical protein VFQ53_15580 [Kofleriaceae bacterium]|nr:hypothetical protein [Kofleriaceae bacterium]
MACGSPSNEPDTIDDVPPDAAVALDAPAVDAAPTDCDEAAQHADFTWIQDHILTPSCATALCHTGATAQVDLRLDAGEAYANLVGKGASTVTGWVRVVPGSPATSYLVVALGRADGPPPRDGFMPLAADPLCAEKLDAVERWILAGAMP